MAGIQEYLDLIKNAVYGRDVRQAIHDGIHQCYEDGKAGTIDLVAREEIAVAEQQIAELVAPTGEAPSAAEVTDARIGADGLVYTSLGLAIREQVSRARRDTDYLVGVTTLPYTKKKYIALNGETADVTALIDNAAYECLAVPCSEGDQFFVTAKGQNATRAWGFVGSDGTVLSVAAANISRRNLHLIAPSGSAYFVSNNQFAQNDGYVIKLSSSPTTLSYRGTAIGSALSEFITKGYYSLDDRESVFSDIPEGFSGNGVLVVYTGVARGSGFTFQEIKSSQGDAWLRVINSSGVVVSDWTKSGGTGGSPSNKWYVLGDSISAGYYSMTQSMAEAAGLTLDYISPVTTEDGETTGSVWDSSLSHNYWKYANDWFLKRTLVGKAYPGQGYYRIASNSQNGVYVVKNNDFSDARLITVAWGFNDWHYNQPRGDHNLIDPSVPYPTEDYDTSQITTVNQAIWYCLGELIRQAPNAKIVVQTPMNGWAYGGDFSTNWGIGYEMSRSGKLSDIHDDIVYWANYYGLQILDMTYNNSIVNRRNIKDTIIDGSHPSDEAHKQLGRHVAIALKYC